MNPHSAIITAGFVALLAAMVAAIFHMLPQWTRPDIYFAVTVSPPFRTTPEGRRILRNYRLQVWICTLGSFALIFLAMAPERIYFLVAGEILLIAGSFTAFIWARHKVLPHYQAPTTVREAALEPRPAHLPGGWLAQLGPFAILMAAAFWLRAHWDQIPMRFPVHWDINGNPNGWSDRTPQGVYGPLLRAAGIMAAMWLLAFGIVTHGRRVRPAVLSGPGKAEFMHRMLVALLVLQHGMAFMFAFMASLPLFGMPGEAIILGVVTLFIAGVFVMISQLSRGGQVPHSVAASSGKAMSSELPAGDGTLDQYWKLGVIYFNPNDAALFVEKRFGVGYTLNFGNRIAWLILAAILVLPILLILANLR